MSNPEECALDVLLFEADGEKLVDIKCYRGDRANVTDEDVKREVHSGLMQHRLQPQIASEIAPVTGVSPRKVAEMVEGLLATA